MDRQTENAVKHNLFGAGNTNVTYIKFRENEHNDKCWHVQKKYALYLGCMSTWMISSTVGLNCSYLPCTTRHNSNYQISLCL